MRVIQIISTIGAERLRDEDPNRDEKRGGNGKGRWTGIEVPFPESFKELPGWTAKMQELDRTFSEAIRYEDYDEKGVLKQLEKGVRLVYQGPMNAALAKKVAKSDDKAARQSERKVDLAKGEAI